MNHKDLYELYIPALSNLYPEVESFMARHDRLVGTLKVDHYTVAPPWSEIPFTDEERDFFHQLTGPYGHVILKAYQIKRGVP